MISDKLIVALDFDNVPDAIFMANYLAPKIKTFKIGMEIDRDPERETLIKVLRDQGSRIFLDLKLIDIGTTIERTVAKIAHSNSADMLTVYGYPDVMYAAAKGAAGTPLELFGISILTSYSEKHLRAAGYTVTPRSLVGQRTDHAVLAEMTGLVCAVEDAKTIRNWSRDTLKLITPGIRMPGEAIHDQVRVATPAQAVKAGVDYMVVGRPITRSDDPLGAIERIIENASL